MQIKKVKKSTYFFLAGAILALGGMFAVPALAQDQDIFSGQEDIAQSPDPSVTPVNEFHRAEVVEVLEEEQIESAGFSGQLQILKLRIVSGKEKGAEIEVRNENSFTRDASQLLRPGDMVILGKVESFGEPFYYIADRYRLTPLIVLFFIFFAAAVFFGRLKGLTSILGLVVSILVLTLFVVPQILAGENPLLITMVGAFTIACISIYLAHGFRLRTTVALFSTLITLGLATLMAVLSVHFTRLFGMGTEEAFFLQTIPGATINLQGLLLGGIIIGTLGVLDDVTTTQTATVDEIRKANKDFTPLDLYKRGLSVGHEHIASLINTLVLAYAGASLPLFILFTSQVQQPLWVILNSELVAEEVVRTLVGSMALILAVPISTFMAAYLLKKYGKEGEKPDEHAHVH